MFTLNLEFFSFATGLSLAQWARKPLLVLDRSPEFLSLLSVILDLHSVALTDCDRVAKALPEGTRE